MRFPYVRSDTRTPIFSLGNLSHRDRPRVDILLVGPGRVAQFYRATVDSGADDTVFPSSVATDLGIDLLNAPGHTSFGAGGQAVPYRYAEVELKLTDGNELFVWNSIVGFGEMVKRPLLGHAGVLQFFDVQLLGEAKQLIINPNPSFPGRIRARKQS